ncbi:Amiloride-sensitive amine oxidase [copper-containing] [Pseudocercospora fuligena]|uniref:Amine oxidase n=1 Tax=Pseudocercospora fuligena TaxID=685502 RepID=A0A8H6RAC7_9PEZI|nr:Amiloride-sensitive amine oxidase [copper-containing] [Pseudocercospora fuligena]
MESWSRSFYYFTGLLVFVTAFTFLLIPQNYQETSYDYQIAGHKTFTAPRKNVWAELSEDEAKDVYGFAYQKLSDLNLVKHPKSANENSIYLVEALKPNKTDAIPYLYEDAGTPERWAKMVLAQNIDGEPYLVYYVVGPLPITKSSQILPLEYTFNSGRNSVRSPIRDYVGIIQFGNRLGKSISDITEDLLGASVTTEDDPEGLLCLPRPSRQSTDGLVLWFQFFRPGWGSGGRTLLPQGVYVKVDASSPNQTDWKVGALFYNGVIYDDVEHLRAAIARPNFKRTPANVDGNWTETEDFDSAPSGRDLPPPVSVQPYGSRYRLDRKEKFVSWFGFEFYITTAQATGLSLFDIRFKGERVMYELGLQEAMAHYAGDDPMAGGQEFLDTFFGMGKNMFELLPGYDCPAYADYLDTQYHMAHEAHELPNSICIFEYTADSLLSRHTAQYSVTASRNTYLVVRSTSTVGNYDYAIDYIFYMDGIIEVKVRASGFIFAAFYRANKTDVDSEDEYGHRIHNALSSSVHDHVINFKADLDVAGPSNDMVRLALEPITKSYSWDLPEVKARNTMHLVEYAVDEELGLDWPKNAGEFYSVYNSEEKNAWGERKGYRITSGTGMGATPHLTIPNSTQLGDSARWAEHDVWVLRQKDTEPRSADPLNYLEPIEPIINFDKMADHESLQHGDDYNGDLVLYFNLGAHHIPHSGDVPNTLMHTSASSVMFVPHNFHDRDPSRESVQGVRLQLKGENSGGFAGQLGVEPHTDIRSRMDRRSTKKEPHAKYFGATYEREMKVPLEAFEPELKNYKTTAHQVTHLTFNNSAAGVWVEG